MRQFEYMIKDEVGIHARPAGLLVKEANRFSASITLEKDGKTGDAKRIFAVMGLAAKQGQEIIVRAEGSDEDAAIKAMQDFLQNNL